MKILFTFFISSIGCITAWILTDIGNNLTIRFPRKPKLDTTTFSRLKMYTSSNENCDFSVSVSDYQKIVFPKTDKEVDNFLEVEVQKSKERGVFISSEKFNVGNIKGIQIRQYFNPKPNIKLIEIDRSFFLNYKHYDLHCLFRGKSQLKFEEDCKRFFASLKVSK